MANTLVIVAEVKQTAAFHIDRAITANLVVLNGHFVQDKVAALLNDDYRLICRSIGNKTAAVEDQRLAASNSQRGTGANRVGNGDIGDVRAQIGRPVIRQLDRRLARLTGRLRGGIIRRKRSRNESAWDEGDYHGQH